MSGHAVVDDFIGQWSAAFNRLDANALSALYSEQALFYGSMTNLFQGRDGVASYFNALTRWTSPTVAFRDIVVTTIGSSVINMAGRATFEPGEDTPPLRVKITWVIVNETDGWHIVSHHVSPIAPLLQLAT